MFFRRRLGSIVAVAIDFAAMWILVRFCHFTPEWGAVYGVVLGAAGRFFALRRRVPSLKRFLFVTLVTALLNGVGEHVLATLANMDWLNARVVVALLVSAAWTSPHFWSRGSQPVA